MEKFAKGQRWISEMEPELGLGIVTEFNNRTVQIHFPASDCFRQYNMTSAPLKRVEFKNGDSLKLRDGREFRVTSVSHENGIIFYHSGIDKMAEDELSDTISFTTPRERLLNGFIDRNKEFHLRQQTLKFQHKSKSLAVRGFMGGRIDLLPHQLFVAHKVTSSKIQRVLLSDETGLGKTIEVCLILHRLLISGRIDRVLILLPASLVHQWFVELLRRFNLIFQIIDHEFCENVTFSNPETNPFLETQLGIISIDFLTSENKWKKLAISSGWDMVVIDEAHHLTEDSAGYLVAKQLAAVSKGLMLLTATPEQLGHRSHFARLQLLDPARYFDYHQFEQEEEKYQTVSRTINKLMENRELDKNEKNVLSKFFQQNSTLQKDESNSKSAGKTNENLIKKLLDRFGTGRAVFRNTRANMINFPKREAILIPLQSRPEDLKQQSLELKNNFDEEFIYDYTSDQRVVWLADFLKKQKDTKILLICNSLKKVKAIENALRKLINTNIALFHENLSLLQRDRNASWFAREQGAQLLICSEIGSEGRNFQFAHDLVLFDLPFDPELLEQRIGRLDRIGQTSTIRIHIPYLIGSEYEILTRWYQDGLNAFEENVPGVYHIFQEIGSQVKQVVKNKDFLKVDELLKKTSLLRKEIIHKMKTGRDRLLEINSFNLELATNITREILNVEKENEIEKYMLNVFRLYGIRYDKISFQTYKLNLLLLSNPEFPLPAIKHDTLIVTFDRETAIKHEDIEFLTWDHPMVSGIMDLILGSEKGNCSVAILQGAEKQEILLEAIYILECVAPKNLYVDRFLPPTPVRIVVNHLLEDYSESFPASKFTKNVRDTLDTSFLENDHLKQEQFPKMMNFCQKLAKNKTPELINAALSKMNTLLSNEITRLVELKKINPNISEDEIYFIKEEKVQLEQALSSARLRLDAIRLIIRG